MARRIVIVAIVVIAATGLVVIDLVLTRPAISRDPSYVDGERIQVLHTEASDRSLVDMVPYPKLVQVGR